MIAKEIFEKEKNRKIRTFSKRSGLRSSSEKWGVRKRKKVESRLLLISGTGRSGTTYMSASLTKAGLDIPHERTGEDGTSTHFFHTDSDWYPMFPWNKGAAHVGERLSDFDFKYQIHIVRHPLKTIASMCKVFSGLDFEFLEDCGKLPVGISPKMLKCMYTYYEINKAYENNADKILQLEKVIEGKRHWSEIGKLIGEKLEFQNLPPKRRATGYNKPEILKWKDLSDKDKILTDNIKRMAKKYGYEV